MNVCVSYCNKMSRLIANKSCDVDFSANLW